MLKPRNSSFIMLSKILPKMHIGVIPLTFQMFDSKKVFILSHLQYFKSELT